MKHQFAITQPKHLYNLKSSRRYLFCYWVTHRPMHIYNKSKWVMKLTTIWLNYISCEDGMSNYTNFIHKEKAYTTSNTTSTTNIKNNLGGTWYMCMCSNFSTLNWENMVNHSANASNSLSFFFFLQKIGYTVHIEHKLHPHWIM